MTDTEINHQAKAALAADERTAGAVIHLRTIDGVVFADGEVESDELKDATEEVIRKVEGVRVVMNHLQVKPPTGHHGRHDRREPESF
jgi:osmotically-inducible protein OsmY